MRIRLGEGERRIYQMKRSKLIRKCIINTETDALLAWAATTTELQICHLHTVPLTAMRDLSQMIVSTVNG